MVLKNISQLTSTEIFSTTLFCWETTADKLLEAIEHQILKLTLSWERRETEKNDKQITVEVFLFFLYLSSVAFSLCLI